MIENNFQLFYSDNVEFFDVSSLQQQEPDLMINGNEIIEIEVATTEEVEDLLSPTYTDENTVHETFDEDISGNMQLLSNFHKLEID